MEANKATNDDATQTEIVRDGYEFSKCIDTAHLMDSAVEDETHYVARGDKIRVVYLSASSGYETLSEIEGRIVHFGKADIGITMLRTDGATVTIEAGEWMDEPLSVKTNGRTVGEVRGEFDDTGISLIVDNYERVPVDNEETDSEISEEALDDLHDFGQEIQTKQQERKGREEMMDFLEGWNEDDDGDDEVMADGGEEMIDEGSTRKLTVYDLLGRDPYERYNNLAPDTDKANLIVDIAVENPGMAVVDFVDEYAVDLPASGGYIRQILERVGDGVVGGLEDPREEVMTDGGHESTEAGDPLEEVMTRVEEIHGCVESITVEPACVMVDIKSDNIPQSLTQAMHDEGYRLSALQDSRALFLELD